MRRLRQAVAVLTLSMAIVLATAAASWSHGTHGYDWWPKIRQHRRERIVNVTHRIFRRHARAHWALDLFDCESQFRWWLRGVHDGMAQFSEQTKRYYAVGWEDGRWMIREQIRSTRRLLVRSGSHHWPNCPNERHR